jgi:hypothetical protein
VRECPQRYQDYHSVAFYDRIIGHIKVRVLSRYLSKGSLVQMACSTTRYVRDKNIFTVFCEFFHLACHLFRKLSGRDEDQSASGLFTRLVVHMPRKKHGMK